MVKDTKLHTFVIVYVVFFLKTEPKYQENSVLSFFFYIVNSNSTVVFSIVLFTLPLSLIFSGCQILM